VEKNMDVVTTDKRLATRKALLDATKELVFEKGHDRISVQEITTRAHLATGTYYNYFETKQDVFVAVAEDLIEELREQLKPSRDATKDPAMLVAMTLKFYFYQAIDDREFKVFPSCVGLSDLSLQQDAEELTADIEAGVKAGRFRVDDVQFTQSLISGMIRHVNQSIRKGVTGRNSVEYAIRSILQMLGLPDLVSKALTQTPLPAIAAPKRQSAITEVGDVNERVTPISRYADAVAREAQALD
jgi:AcrR family transcriptional regulator